MSSKTKPIRNLLNTSYPPSTPPSAFSIPSSGAPFLNLPRKPSAIIRPVGPTRSVYLLNSHLTPTETSGLAHRLSILARNTSLNSISISFADDDYVDRCTVKNEDGTKSFYFVPRSAEAYDRDAIRDATDNAMSPPSESKTFGAVEHPFPSPAHAVAAMASLTELARCTHHPATKIPLIFVPDGTIEDGGYALGLASHYTVCSAASSYRMRNPLRGLSLDPIGLSFIFNRLGVDDNDDLVSSLSFAMGRMVSLFGYRMDGWDMLGVGMGTHMIDPKSADRPIDMNDVVNLLEGELERLPPHDEQKFLPKPKMTMGEVEWLKQNGDRMWEDDVVNERYKNVTVHDLLKNLGCVVPAEYLFGQGDLVGGEEYERAYLEDESESWGQLLEERPMVLERTEVTMVTVASALKEILERDSLEGVVEGLKEVAAAGDEDGGSSAVVAKEFLGEMGRRSPLALRAVDRLLKVVREGRGGEEESLESCAARESRVMLNLLRGEDYKSWSGKNPDGSTTMGEMKWKHESVMEVTDDEVEALFGAESE